MVGRRDDRFGQLKFWYLGCRDFGERERMERGNDDGYINPCAIARAKFSWNLEGDGIYSAR